MREQKLGNTLDSKECYHGRFRESGAEAEKDQAKEALQCRREAEDSKATGGRRLFGSVVKSGVWSQ
jgi:hypothetical protein